MTQKMTLEARLFYVGVALMRIIPDRDGYTAIHIVEQNAFVWTRKRKRCGLSTISITCSELFNAMAMNVHLNNSKQVIDIVDIDMHRIRWIELFGSNIHSELSLSINQWLVIESDTNRFYLLETNGELGEIDCTIDNSSRILSIKMLNGNVGLVMCISKQKSQILGSSTNDAFIATHYDLFICNPTDYTTYVDSTFRIHKWENYLLVKKLGQISINDIQMFYSPIHFAQDLEHRLINNVYNHMCQQNKGPN
ncbi:unnamed protein product [Didymodactylos carnosus]|uniref:Uncharacterized protein n=1 Tax=Didymodactylos carnosus TaxID=1234261 RepID=A0A814YLX0_9BILA|nr:unnamed protein product [Didymodactylos carnosus]CAF1259346.1 unnamed protein product [Didymodactylos carnosus]CAF3994813.1 unnamed protein product [Didymodactylos carnosus]CAF4066160.1 unnamed protein product [Didymodactylos carnosus]